MNIALMAHDAKKELMVQFCIAYCGILSRHTLLATGTTGNPSIMISFEDSKTGDDSQWLRVYGYDSNKKEH